MKYPITILLLLITLSSLSAQSSLQRAANQLVSKPSLRHASVSLCVMDVESGEVLAEHDAQRSLKPASNLKVLTTGSALALLGGDYRFKTALEYDGRIGALGRLEGNLYLKGYGDPSLGSPVMEAALGPAAAIEQFRLAVQRAGIRSVAGQVVGDASVFGTDAYVRTWQWEDMGNYYGAGAWSLNWHENLHYLDFQRQPQGQPPLLRGSRPEVPGLRFFNELSSGPPNSGDRAYIFGAPYQYERYVRGSLPAGSGTFTIKGALPDPPLLAAQQLRQALAEVAISSGPADRQFAPGKGNRTLLHLLYSPSLAELVERANMESVNLYCEAMLRAIGLEVEGEGSTDAGLEAIKSYWESRGLSWSGIYLADGSGLSEGNAVNAYFLAAFMRKMALGPAETFSAFEASLPLAGQSGSMKNSLKGTAADGRLHAKTGTLERVRAFTGYARSRSGKRLAYSVMVNNFEGSGGAMRRELEAFLLALCQ